MSTGVRHHCVSDHHVADLLSITSCPDRGGVGCIENGRFVVEELKDALRPSSCLLGKGQDEARHSYRSSELAEVGEERNQRSDAQRTADCAVTSDEQNCDQSEGRYRGKRWGPPRSDASSTKAAAEQFPSRVVEGLKLTPFLPKALDNPDSGDGFLSLGRQIADFGQRIEVGRERPPTQLGAEEEQRGKQCDDDEGERDRKCRHHNNGECQLHHGGRQQWAEREQSADQTNVCVCSADYLSLSQCIVGDRVERLEMVVNQSAQRGFGAGRESARVPTPNINRK